MQTPYRFDRSGYIVFVTVFAVDARHCVSRRSFVLTHEGI